MENRNTRVNTLFILVLLLAAAMNLLRIGHQGFANLYYAASVKSMLMDAHNFFFVSYDPGGFISVDKPPLGFWIQALSALIFGFHGWSIILPQALAGIISVALVYKLVKHHWGSKAGLLAAFTLAVMPISVAANRNNTIDSLLTMTVLFAAWAMVIAVEHNEKKWLYGTMFIMGLAYNIKTLEAFLVLPALCLVYLATGEKNVRYRLFNLAGSLGLLVVVALSWSVVVDLIPASQRPYVGSSETNSELELATGYNGILHFLGKGVQVPGVDSNVSHTSGAGNMGGISPGASGSNAEGGPGTPGPMPPGGPGGGGAVGMASFAFETGNPSVIRLFQRQIGGQISWLLPLALSGLLVAGVRSRNNDVPVKQSKNISLLLWSGWLLPQLIFFSIAVDYHRYYLVMIAPAIAALVGIGLKELWDVMIEQRYPSRLLLPMVITINLAVELAIIWQFDEWRRWLLPLVAIAGIIGISLLLNAIRRQQLQSVGIVIAVITLYIPQVAWALTPMIYGDSSVLPYAGPDLNPQAVQGAKQGMAMPEMTVTNKNSDTSKLKEFLLANRNGEKFILAVGNAQEASQIIIDTGQPVMAVGGFMGMETILTADDFEHMVNEGKVRYVLISGNFSQSQSELNAWVNANGKMVPKELWEQNHPEPDALSPGSQLPSNGMDMMRQSQQLFDCAPKK